MLLVNLLTIACGLAVGAGLVLAMLAARREDAADGCWTGESRAIRCDRLIAATIVAMPLLMPFYFDYDLLLLAVPAVLLASEIASRPPGCALSSSDRRLIGFWIALYLWLMINPVLAPRCA